MPPKKAAAKKTATVKSKISKSPTKEVEPITGKRRAASKKQPAVIEAAVAASTAPVDAGAAETKDTATTPAPLQRKKSDPSLRKIVKKGSKSEAPAVPASQDDYATAYGEIAGKCKVMSWNVNGINAWLGNGGLATLAKDAPHVVCLQEVKANDVDVAKWSKALRPDYPHIIFSCCSVQKGYAGTAVLSKIKPISVHYGLDDDDKHEPEGRVILVEFAGFILVNTYVPNSGMKLENLEFRQQWDAKLLQRMLSLSKKLGNKPLLWTGDLNVAHTDYDLALPDSRRNKVPGACDEERADFDAVLAAGFVDVWRKQKGPAVQHFTFWSYKQQSREKNNGWRLDYWLASHGLDAKLGDTFIRSKAAGSDHVPIGVLVDAKML